MFIVNVPLFVPIQNNFNKATISMLKTYKQQFSDSLNGTKLEDKTEIPLGPSCFYSNLLIKRNIPKFFYTNLIKIAGGIK